MARKIRMTFEVAIGPHREKGTDSGVVQITVEAESVDEGKKLVRELLDEHYAGHPRDIPSYPVALG